MKRIALVAVLALPSAVFAKDRTVQVQVESRILEFGPGVMSANFGLNLGNVYANLPSDLTVGERVSGSLAVVPKGKTDAERSANAAALRALDIDICGSKVSVASGIFVCPRVSSDRMEILLDIHPIARLFVEPKVVTLPTQPAFILPAEAVARGRSRILGPFSGDLAGTSVSIAGSPAHLVAESPRSCIFDVPEGPAGPGTIELRDGASSSTGPFRIIGLHLTPPTPIIHTGDTTSFAAEVYGLSGLDHTVSLVLKNLSTGVVSMEGGDEQTMPIAPANVSSSGTFAISRNLMGLHRGDYAVNVSVPWEEAPIGKDTAIPSDSAIEEPPIGRKGISLSEAMKKLPFGYKIVHGREDGFHAEPDSLRPGLPLAWDEAHGTWTPPGYVPNVGDPDRAFNQTTGDNAVWDEKTGQWIDAKTGESLSYDQNGAGKRTVKTTHPMTGEIHRDYQKGISFSEAMKKLPSGYKIVHGRDGGFHAEPDSLRPGLPLAWDEAHGTWTPPGYVPNVGDPDRAFNPTAGQNAVWDDKAGKWIDAQTGKVLSYEQ